MECHNASDVALGSGTLVCCIVLRGQNLPGPELVKSTCMTSFYIFFDTFFILFLDPSWIDFGGALGSILAPTMDQKSIQQPFKTHPKLHLIFDRFFDRFFIDFGSILDPKLVPKTIKNRFQNQSKKSLI